MESPVRDHDVRTITGESAALAELRVVPPTATIERVID